MTFSATGGWGVGVGVLCERSRISDAVNWPLASVPTTCRVSPPSSLPRLVALPSLSRYWVVPVTYTGCWPEEQGPTNCARGCSAFPVTLAFTRHRIGPLSTDARLPCRVSGSGGWGVGVTIGSDRSTT